MARELLSPRSILASEEQPDETVVKEILRYFVRNPKAADSLEGIARWRLIDEMVRRKVNETRAALDWLVERGLLNRTPVAGGEPIFSLNLDNRSEAEALAAVRPRSRERKGGQGG
jgi:hypothetical protein